MRFLLSTLALILVSSVAAFSQETWTRFNNTNQITDIAVHGDDVWCATTGGLVRWDRRTGTYQEILPKDNSAYNIVTTIVAAPDGTIWGIVRGDTYAYANDPPYLYYHPPTPLVHYDGNSWSEYDSSWYDYGAADQQGNWQPKSATSLTVGPDGALWAGISYDLSNMSSTYIASLGRGLSCYRNGLWSNTTIGNWPYGDIRTTFSSGPKFIVSSIATSADGLVWVNTAGSGIFRYDGQTVQSVEGGGQGRLYIGPDGTVWLVGQKTIQRREGETWTSVTIPGELLPRDIDAFACDADNRLWIGTNNGLIRYDWASWKRYSMTDGLVSDSITSLATNDSGILWIGTTEGLASFDGISFHTYRTEERLRNENVRTLAFEKNGTVWAGTSSGITRYNGKTWRSFTIADGLPGNTINGIAVTPKGDVWVGTTNGAARYYGSGWKAYTNADGLASDTIHSIATDKDGRVWFGTDNGVSCYDGTAWRSYGNSNNITFLVIAADGVVWAANSNKIFRCAMGQWKSYKTMDRYLDFGYSCEITGLSIDSTGFPQVSYKSSDGSHGQTYHIIFMRVDADAPDWATVVAGESGILTCFTIAPDSTTWFATTRRYGGFYTSQTSSPGLHRKKEGPSNVFTISNGLSSGIINAVAIAPDGAVWCGTDAGLSRYGLPMTTGVASESALPKELAVMSNYPNPFNPSTTISFSIPNAGRAQLSVYSITGQKIRTLLSGPMTAGMHSVIWDGKDDEGKPTSSGVYLAHLRVGKTVSCHKMLFMK